MPRSREELESRRSELEQELAEVSTELEGSLEDAADAAAEAVAETAEGSVEAVAEAEEAAAEASADAAEAAEEAAEEVEEAVEAAVEATPGIDTSNFEEVYARTVERLRADGVIPNPEVALEAPAEIAEVVADEITPRDSHPWTRPRRFLGRTW